MKRKKWFVLFLIMCMALLPGKQAMAAGDIQIDGLFDDWEDIPKTDVGWGGTNGEQLHDVALFTDGEYLYGYVRMSGLYDTVIPAEQYMIEINGTVMAHTIRGCNADGTPDYSRQINGLESGTYADDYAFYGNGWTKSGDVAVCIISGSTNDALEFAMPLADLERLYGFEEGSLTGGAMARSLSIQMWNPNLGGQKVALAGTSTGVLVGIGLCLAVVGGVWFFRKKGKRLA